MKLGRKDWIALGVLLTGIAWELYQKSKGKSLLGSRTVSASADFVKKLWPIAKAYENQTGIKAFLGMAEASEESNYGLSQLASPPRTLGTPGTGGGNNLFGITAEPGTYWRDQGHPYVEMPTHEWLKNEPGSPYYDASKPEGSIIKVAMVRPFRAYPSWAASYADWGRLMQTQHYVDAGALAALKSGNPQEFGAALNRAGYASDPNYGLKVEGRVQVLEPFIQQEMNNNA